MSIRTNIKRIISAKHFVLGMVVCFAVLSLTSCSDHMDNDARQLAAESYARRQLQRQYNEYRNEYINNFNNVNVRNPDSVAIKATVYRSQMTELNTKMDALKREIEALNSNIGAINSEYSRRNDGRDLYELNKEVSAISTLYYK